MGWTSDHSVRNEADAIRAALAELPIVDPKFPFYVHRDGSGQSEVYAMSRPIGHSNERAIFVVLIAKKYGEWAWKTMDHSMGPHYYDTPPAWLERDDITEAYYGGKWLETARARVVSPPLQNSQAT